MQDDSVIVRSYLQQHAVSQKELARLAGVSQSTVSRACKAPPAKHSEPHAKLLQFIKSDTAPHDRLEEPAKHVIAAFERIWDGTEAHARAICHVIDALAEFQQPLASKTPGD